MSTVIEGNIDGKGLRVGVVVARFNELITSNLLKGTKSGLTSYGVSSDDITTVKVPGSFEIPLTAKILAESGQYEAVVCLGAVIRGQTDHYTHIATQTAKGISDVALNTGLPVIFGVLTTDTVEQAMDRAGDDKSNAGYNAALVAIEMANLLRILDSD